MTESHPATFGGRLLIGASGSVAVAMLPTYISALRGRFTGSVSVLMTHTAKEFLPAHTAALFADRVITGEPPWGSRYDVYAGGPVEGPVPPPPPAFVEAISAHMPR
jgi:hypothetical protein